MSGREDERTVVLLEQLESIHARLAAKRPLPEDTAEKRRVERALVNGFRQLAASTPERRKHERRVCALAGWATRNGERSPAVVLNLGEGGAFVVVRSPLAKGDRLEVLLDVHHYHLPQPLELSGAVSWTSGLGASHTRAGLVFGSGTLREPRLAELLATL